MRAGDKNNLFFSWSYVACQDRAPPPKCGFVRSHRSESEFWKPPLPVELSVSFRSHFKCRFSHFTLVLMNSMFGFYRSLAQCEHGLEVAALFFMLPLTGNRTRSVRWIGLNSDFFMTRFNCIVYLTIRTCIKTPSIYIDSFMFRVKSVSLMAFTSNDFGCVDVCRIPAERFWLGHGDWWHLSLDKQMSSLCKQ